MRSLTNVPDPWHHKKSLNLAGQNLTGRNLIFPKCKSHITSKVQKRQVSHNVKSSKQTILFRKTFQNVKVTKRLKLNFL
jgi:hypothetical protein